jgi:histidine ammonia-lyase
MGTNAAVITAKVIENAFEVLAIELITIVQAIDCLEQKDSISSVTRKMYDEVRQIIPKFSQDQVMYPFVQEVKDYLINN